MRVRLSWLRANGRPNWLPNEDWCLHSRAFLRYCKILLVAPIRTHIYRPTVVVSPTPHSMKFNPPAVRSSVYGRSPPPPPPLVTLPPCRPFALPSFPHQLKCTYNVCGGVFGSGGNILSALFGKGAREKANELVYTWCGHNILHGPRQGWVGEAGKDVDRIPEHTLSLSLWLLVHNAHIIRIQYI